MENFKVGDCIFTDGWIKNGDYGQSTFSDYYMEIFSIKKGSYGLPTRLYGRLMRSVHNKNQFKIESTDYYIDLDNSYKWEIYKRKPKYSNLPKKVIK